MTRIHITLLYLLAFCFVAHAQENKTDSTNTQKTKNKIEIFNDDYLINGVIAKQKDVDVLMSKSNNPAITMPLKAAKASAKAQKIIKITSYPTTIIGSAGTLFLAVDFIADIRRHRDNAGTYLGFFSSFAGTISLPITNKIMQKKTKKMYGKLITIYNVTN